MPSVVGIDIAKGKWACVELQLDDDLRQVRSMVGRALPYKDEIELAPDCLVAVIDVPIGLLNDADARQCGSKKDGLSGCRPIDRGAKKWCLSKSSVFSSPTEGQLTSGLREHERARQEGTRRRVLANVVPRGLTAQCLELLPAISSAQTFKSRYPSLVFESHPEAAFASLSNGIIPGSKKSLLGALCRSAVLSQRIGIDTLEWVARQAGISGIESDDWLDATAMAVVALDWASDSRAALLDETGAATPWDGRSDFLMAMPQGCARPPKRLELTQALAMARTQLQVP